MGGGCACPARHAAHTHLGGDGDALPGAGHGLTHIPEASATGRPLGMALGAGLLIPAMTMSSVTCDHVYKAHMLTSCSLSPFPPRWTPLPVMWLRLVMRF